MESKVYAGDIVEIQVLGKMEKAFSLRVGQKLRIRIDGKLEGIEIVKIERDMNWLALYNRDRLLIFVVGEDGEEFLWKEFIDYTSEITYGK